MRWMSAMTLGSFVLSGGLALAQQEANTQQAERREPIRERQADREGPLERRNADRHDAMFANCLAIDNAAEAAIAEFAAQRLQDDQAKQFAQQMIRDHRAMIEKLGQFGAKEVTFAQAGQPRAETAEGTRSAGVTSRAGEAGQRGVNVQAGDERRTDRRDARAERRSGGDIDFVAIKKEIAQECVHSAQEELTAKPPGEVDRCYMASQVFAHQHMLDALKVLERHASAELKPALAEAAQTTQLHLEQAKAILQSLEGKQQPADSSATSGAPNRP